MDNFYTSVKFPEPAYQIGPASRILSIGSCFAGHIGNFFITHKFRALVNPTGILFNPASIVKNLQMIMRKTPMTEEVDLMEHHDDLWHSLLHHGQFSGPNFEGVIKSIDQATEAANQFLTSANLLIITLGTAHIYRHQKSGEIVANCHKIPSAYFVKELLDFDTILHNMKTIIEHLASFNPRLEIILSVSPVRYIRDGMVESNLSKAILLLVTHELVKQHEHCHYFPAYEILIDELRDYRFYEKDLVHPSPQSIAYILEKFVQSYLNEPAQKQVQVVKKLKQALDHRPIHPESRSHQHFRDKMNALITDLKKEYPLLDFSAEEQQLKG